MKRYKTEQLRVSGPIRGFLIHTPSGKKMRDIYPNTIVKELNRMAKRIKRLEEAVEAYRTAYTPDGHVAPHDCFATGPKTGNPIEDLVACPGCWAERKAKEAKL